MIVCIGVVGITIVVVGIVIIVVVGIVIIVVVGIVIIVVLLGLSLNKRLYFY